MSKWPFWRDVNHVVTSLSRVAVTCKSYRSVAFPRVVPCLCDILCGVSWQIAELLVASIWLTCTLFTQNFISNHAWNINISGVGIFIYNWNNMTYLNDSFQFSFGYNSSWALSKKKLHVCLNKLNCVYRYMTPYLLHTDSISTRKWKTRALKAMLEVIGVRHYVRHYNDEMQWDHDSFSDIDNFSLKWREIFQRVLQFPSVVPFKHLHMESLFGFMVHGNSISCHLSTCQTGISLSVKKYMAAACDQDLS